jgi:DNA helicase-2/ATP-dependent DNA helicase PcrA
VRHNRDRHQKVLKAFKKAKHEVRSLELPDEQMEAERVVGEIRLEHEKRAVPYKDFAILFRTNEQPRIFEDELRRRGIPYVLMGSQSFYDRKEIKDLICYMKAIARPDDEQALLRIINTPARGIGDTSLEKINAAAVREGSTFWEAVPKLASEKLINQKTFDALQLFREQLQKWQKQFDAEPGRMDELMHALIQEIDYFAEIDRQYKEPPQQAARKAMVEDYVNSLADYIKQARQPSLMDYLAGIALERRDEEPDKEKMVGQDAVKLLTLHSAKGLEFPRVYMVGMEEGILPHKRSVDATENEIAEERRLAYVGVTRAQEQLTLTRAATRRKWGKPRQTLPSRFLFEMKREEPR